MFNLQWKGAENKKRIKRKEKDEKKRSWGERNFHWENTYKGKHREKHERKKAHILGKKGSA